MIPVLTNQAMRNCDQRGSEEFHIPTIALMESAGRAIADEAAAMVGCNSNQGLHGKRFFILCGTGNNGGDGFVAARHLLNRGGEVWLRLVGDRSKIAGDALTMLKPLEQLRATKGLRRNEIDTLQEAEIDTLSYIRFDVVVDALFGTGFTGDVRGPAAEAIDLLRRFRNEKVPLLAVDIPSGLAGDTGAPGGLCAGADTTVTFARHRNWDTISNRDGRYAEN